eukprot:CAMPEP_0172499654 /NCGR_PEP_ID=MMETSP1066-20121228/129208_1 /TAXON_ID=671091 /ORGANISM="Coscinodiscus wailesii, Strain CCMP2513" /LENGTH=596 /DNA_ID=CAMNT_0013273519 /DNA_START=91 /DNA_END=1881 /DNA_ORIENTATION=-
MRVKFEFLLSLFALNPYVAVGVDAFSTPPFTPRNAAKYSAKTRGGDSTAMHYQTSKREDTPSTDDFEEELSRSSNFETLNLDEIIPAEYIAEANLPTDIGHFRLRAYRMKKDAGAFVGSEPCVIYATHKPPGRCGVGGKARNVPVRIHDQCFTSEVFRSQRCDCKEQLVMALKYILEHGGAIIYLQQEGRGIGLANKVAAYALQDTGLDTVDANIHLGFPEDNRYYGMIPSMLEDLGIASIQLLTNNPLKVERLRSLGVEVENTVPMVVEEINQWNRRYIETKVERMRHNNFNDLSNVNNNFILPRLNKNGMMAPRKNKINGNENNNESSLNVSVNIDIDMNDDSSHALDPNGVLAASNAITSALYNDTGNVLTQLPIGAKADNSGYCFGRQSVEAAIAAIKRGELVVVVDDEDRENEGDFIMAADMVTPETMAVMVRYTSGVLCVGMEGDRMDKLKLPPMVENNQDPKGTAFTVSVDATEEHGITTGISAKERAITIKMLGKSTATADDFHRPGHIFPLRAKPNGVIARDGHTEASVDLSRLAGLSPVGVLCEIVSEENPVEMARLPELRRFCAKHGFVLTSIADIIQYRKDTGL